MKKFIQISLMTLFLIAILYRVSGAEHWQKVVEKGFGDPKNNYAWSMASFKGQLYASTLNEMGGAEIWRSPDGQPNTWTRVFKSYPFTNLGIRCLYADGDQALYAGTYNKFGAQILRSTDGKNWTVVLRGGFENRRNHAIRCIVRFGEHIYAGGGRDEAELYRSRDGFTWEKVKTEPSFASTQVLDPITNATIINNIMIGELAVFKKQLYAFTWTTDLGVFNRFRFPNVKPVEEFNEQIIPQFFARTPGAFEVWRSDDGIKWEKVVGQDDPYGNGMGFSLHDDENMANDVVTSVAVFDGHLYLGPENANGRNALWRTADGTTWEKVLDFWNLGEAFNFYIWRMISFEGELYVGTFNAGPVPLPGVTGAQLWASGSGNPGSFYKFVPNGFDGETTSFYNIKIPKNYGIRSLAVHNNTLFAGTATILSIPVTSFESVPGSQSPILGITIAGKDVGCEIWELVK